MGKRGKWARTTGFVSLAQGPVQGHASFDPEERKKILSEASALEVARKKWTSAKTEQARQAAIEEVAASAELLQELRRQTEELKSKRKFVEEVHVVLPGTTSDPIFLTEDQVRYLQKKKAAAATRFTSEKRTRASARTRAAKRAERSPRKHPKESHAEAPEAPWRRPKRTSPVCPRGSAGIIAVRHKADGDESEDEADGRSPIPIDSSPRGRHKEGCSSHEPSSIAPPVRGAKPKYKAMAIGAIDRTKAESAKRRMPAHPGNFAHEILATNAVNPDRSPRSDNALTEPQLRQPGNDEIKAQLQSGQGVVVRYCGTSLRPLVHSGDLCSFTPVSRANQVEVGDIVFCQVRGGEVYQTHLIMSKTYDDEVEGWYFTIENPSGRHSACCWIETIYGKLTVICPDAATSAHVDGEAASAGAVTQ